MNCLFVKNYGNWVILFSFAIFSFWINDKNLDIIKSLNTNNVLIF